MKIHRKLAISFVVLLSLGLVTQPVSASSFNSRLKHNFSDLSDPEVKILSKRNKTIYLSVKEGFHPDPEPEVYAYYTLHAVKHSKGWAKYNQVQMRITGYYESPNGESGNETTKIWTISTTKLKTINFSDKALDENNDTVIDITEIRDFSEKLAQSMDSIQ